jgi:peptidoglycan/xylan/chitin deacetylase (PgdA/CDA1 family)
MPPGLLTSSACRSSFLGVALLVAATLAANLWAPTARSAPDRRLAITIDDLPFLAGDLSPESIDRGTEQLLAALTSHGAPAIGFVNEIKLAEGGGTDAQVGRLRRWLDAGLQLGNHTHSHRSLANTPIADYEADVLRGEAVTRGLLAERSLTPKYFRHPYTNTGPTADVKARFEGFLSQHGYQVAPFTIEHADYVFNRVWRDLRRAGDRDGLTRLRRDYLAHLDTMTAYFEGLSAKVFGREVAQVLLTHANEINAACLDEMLARLKARGYRFISLDEAMRDEAYRTEDRFVGSFGPSWLHRWGIARGFPVSMRDEPDPPQWVLDAYQDK